MADSWEVDPWEVDSGWVKATGWGTVRDRATAGATGRDWEEAAVRDDRSVDLDASRAGSTKVPECKSMPSFG